MVLTKQNSVQELVGVFNNYEKYLDRNARTVIKITGALLYVFQHIVSSSKFYIFFFYFSSKPKPLSSDFVYFVYTSFRYSNSSIFYKWKQTNELLTGVWSCVTSKIFRFFGRNHINDKEILPVELPPISTIHIFC